MKTSKTKRRSICSAILSLAMLSQGVTAVMAEGTTASEPMTRYYSKAWSINVVNDAASDPEQLLYKDWGTENAYIAGTSNPDEVRSGDYAYKFVMPLATCGNRYVDVRTPANIEAGVEYKLSFYIRGDESWGWGNQYGWDQIKIGPSWNETILYDSSFTRTQEGDWLHYEKTFTMASGASEFRIAIDGSSKNFIVDDVSICKTGTTDNILADGGFEDVYCAKPVGTLLHEKMSATVSDAATELAGIMGTYAYAGPTNLPGETRGGSKYAYKIVQPIPQQSNKFMQILAPVNLEAGKNYTIGFWAKGYFDKSLIAIGDYVWPYDGLNGYTVGTTDSEGWTYYYKTIESWNTGNGNYLRIGVDSGCYAMFIDDLTITEVDSSTDLITWGDFESGIYDTGFVGGISTNKWTASPAGENLIAEYGKTVHAGVTNREDEVHSGDYAYKIVQPRASEANHFLNITAPVAIEANTDYTFSFWAKGNFDPYGIWMGAFWPYNWIGDFQKGETDENGWTYYSKSGLSWTSSASELVIQADHACPLVLIDDFSICKTGTSENILENGDFEDTVITTEITNMIAYPTVADGGAVVSWFNPIDTASSITLAMDGEAVEGFTCDLTSGAFNTYAITGLEDGQICEFTLTAVIDGEEYSQTRRLVVNNGSRLDFAGKYPMGGWQLWKSDAATNDVMYYSNAIANFDNGAIRMDFNMPVEMPNVYAGITQQVTLSTANKYQFEFWAKVENINMLTVTEQNDDIDIWNPYDQINSRNGETVSHDWKKYTVILHEDDYDTMNDPKDFVVDLRIGTTMGAGTIWVDKAALYALDEDDEIASENLLINPEFDVTPYTIGDVTMDLLDAEGNLAIEDIEKLEPGKIRFGTEFRNTSGGDMDMTVIFALYNGTELKEIDFVSETVSEHAEGMPAEAYWTVFDIPTFTEEDDYYVKVMYWDNFKTMEPYCTAEIKR